MNNSYKSNHKKFKKKNKSIYDTFPKKKSEKSLCEPCLGITPDITLGCPIITALGNSEICIENYKNIIEYNESIIKIHTKSCRIVINGKNLKIGYFTDDEMRITGRISCIEYIL